MDQLSKQTYKDDIKWVLKARKAKVGMTAKVCDIVVKERNEQYTV